MKITIPPAALEAGARAIGEETYISNKETQKAAARAAFEAMVEAWPDMAHRVMPYAALILPLPTEASDE